MTVNDPCTMADKFEEAATYIEDHGWTQGVFEDGRGAVCALGAIRAVSAEKFNLRCDMDEVLGAEIRAHTRFVNVPAWNDYKSRTSPVTVIQTMRGLATKLRRASGGCE